MQPCLIIILLTWLTGYIHIYWTQEYEHLISHVSVLLLNLCVTLSVICPVSEKIPGVLGISSPATCCVVCLWLTLCS